ncbi:MAG: M61 family metallopeptidase [Fidelibacterota bacterium]
MRNFKFALWGIFMMWGTVMAEPRISYTLSMPEPSSHYFHVTLSVEDYSGKSATLKMPVWTPGSYLVREFSRNIPRISASSGKHELTVQKNAKNVWEVATGGTSNFTVTYKVYAYEQTVRTSFLNSSRGYLNGASVFLYIDGLQDQPGELKIQLPRGWRKISTGLQRVDGKIRTFAFANYDILVDSPILLGNHEVHKFKVDGTPHEIAIYGESNLDKEKFLSDTKAIVSQTRELFGSFPYDRYVFLILLLESGGGGLEHLNSCTVQGQRWKFSDEKKYKDFLTLISHEFFHTWNVKRMRPLALGPFDYDVENYTTDLWIAEGFTEYYESVIPYRAGLFTEEDYFDYVGRLIKQVETTPGRTVQSLAEASFDTWIKYYRPNENSPNTQISYYSKGALVGLLLNLTIIENTGGKQSLDDILRKIYHEIYEDKQRGFTATEFRLICEKVAGRNLQDIWQYVDTTDELDYNRYLSYVGCELERSYADETKASNAYFGFKYRTNDGRIVIKTVYDGTPAAESNVNVNDELIALNGNRLTTDNIAKLLKEVTIGEKSKLLLSREGEIIEVEVIPSTSPPDKFIIKRLEEATPDQKQLFEVWLGSSWEK